MWAKSEPGQAGNMGNVDDDAFEVN